MIPDIGVMIGAYIVVRMVDLILRPIRQKPAAQVVVAILAVIAIIIAIICTADLLMRGVETSMPRS